MSGDEEMLSALGRIESWLAIIARAQLSAVAKVELADDKMARLYEKTGELTREKIQKSLKLSPNTITEAWKRWEQQGLLVKEGVRYRKVL